MKFVFQQVADLADQELYDDGAIREQLMLLQLQLEEGDIDDDDEYIEQEALPRTHRRLPKTLARTAIPAAVDWPVAPYRFGGLAADGLSAARHGRAGRRAFAS
jgi:Gas vesicle protein G